MFVDESIFKFQKLSPTNNVNRVEYDSALDFVFEAGNSDIRNISISGPYSSGKSSIINSYEEKKNKKFIHICIPHFNGAEECTDEGVIENKIVNSLLQQIPASQIPDSKFQIKNDDEYSNIMHTIGVFIVIIFALYASNYNNIYKILSKRLGSSIAAWAPSVATKFYGLLFVLAAISLLGIIYSVIKGRITKGKQISKINFNFGELEMQPDDQSYFDKNIDEILYLITHAECDGFVFEDIDRFPLLRVTLLEHLRELCLLANDRIKMQQGNDAIIRFFYLVSDETFSADDRGKFFDFNISVIPVVDGNNSYDKLVEYLNAANLRDSIDERFLRGISLYIDDLRMVKNIVNDYQIFLSCLANVDVNKTKLLAMVAFKNAFPGDYADLEKNRGYVYSFFSDREFFIRNNSKNIESNGKKIYELIANDEEFDLYFSKEIFNGIVDNHYYPMLKYLLINGYIDEDSYKSYMSLFYEGGISRRDKDFLLAVNERRELELDYKLDNVKLVFELLSENDFYNQTVKNFMLIDYLCSKKTLELAKSDKRNKSLDILFSKIKANNDLKYISSYIDYEEHIYNDNCYQFMSGLLAVWNSVVDDLAASFYGTSDDSYHEIDDFKVQSATLDKIIKECITILPKYGDSENDIKNPEFSRYLSHEVCYDFPDEDVDKYKKLVNAFDVEIEDIETNIHNSKFLEHVFKNNKYSQNDKNQRYLLLAIYSLDIQAYGKVSDITTIDKELWNFVVKNGAMEATTKNLESYYKYNFSKADSSYKYNIRIDEELVAFLNSKGKDIDYKSLEKKVKTDFWSDVVNINEIHDDIFEIICNQIGEKYDDIGGENIEPDRIKYLIAKGLINMTGSNITAILEEYPELYEDYILSDIDGFIKNLSNASSLLDGESIKYIIESPDFTDEQKFEIYKRANGEQKLKNIKVTYPKMFVQLLEKYKKAQRKKQKQKRKVQQAAVKKASQNEKNDGVVEKVENNEILSDSPLEESFTDRA